MTDLSLKDKLAFFEELIGIGTNLSMWQYGSDGHLSHTNSDYLVLDRFFENSGCKAYMLSHSLDHTSPMILSGPMGLMWSAVIRKQNGIPYTYHVIGPVFNSELSQKSIEEFARQFQIDLTWRKDFIRMLETLPVLSVSLFFHYTLMLHYCINNEKLDRSDLHFQRSRAQQPESDQTRSHGERILTWNAERNLLNKVKEGDMNYQSALRRAGLLSGGVNAAPNDSVLQALISGVTFTALCSREAIGAGISPETAYSVGDHYIQSMVESRNISEIVTLNHAMYEDFIQRVHRKKSRPKVSPAIQSCIDYIELHAKEPLTLKLIADRTGYSEYHLSRKFKQELGVSVTRFIQNVRVDLAKDYLALTDDTISQIADRLQFSSGSHFSSVFFQITGKKPSEYRSEEQRK